MNEHLISAKTLLLSPGGITEPDLEQVLARILDHSIEYADLYFQTSRFESWSLEDSKVKDGSFSIEQGVGVRAVSEDKTGFAYSDEINLNALNHAALAARAICHTGGKHKVQRFTPVAGHGLYLPADPLDSLAGPEKIQLMEAVDLEARKQDSRIKQVMVSLAGEYEVILVVASDGTLAADIRPLVRLSVSVVAEDGKRREQGSSGGGGRYSYRYFLDENRALSYAREAARQALINLQAVDAPAGTLQVVLGPGWPGVLLHEAVGHGLEGDFNRKGSSAFSGRMGQQVAAKGCTVIDDGTLNQRRGSLNIDDEGTPTQSTVLIENGILTAYLQDKLNARLMGYKATGNGRRESYAHLPMPRMTNTFMANGPYGHEEIIASVKKGLYAANFAGGQVDITSGKFVFSANEAYLIENGKLGAPVKGATLIGNGPDVLTRVSMVGNNMSLDLGVGTCGKEGQSVPVGVGQPTLRIDGLTVGGTHA